MCNWRCAAADRRQRHKGSKRIFASACVATFNACMQISWRAIYSFTAQHKHSASRSIHVNLFINAALLQDSSSQLHRVPRIVVMTPLSTSSPQPNHTAQYGYILVAVRISTLSLLTTCRQQPRDCSPVKRFAALLGDCDEAIANGTTGDFRPGKQDVCDELRPFVEYSKVRLGDMLMWVNETEKVSESTCSCSCALYLTSFYRRHLAAAHEQPAVFVERQGCWTGACNVMFDTKMRFCC